LGKTLWDFHLQKQSIINQTILALEAFFKNYKKINGTILNTYSHTFGDNCGLSSAPYVWETSYRR
jgi:hypothetical protein